MFFCRCRLMLLDYKAEGMWFRNDNASQFTANTVREYLKEKGVYQESSHVDRPQDNAYIEALHSNQQRVVIDRYYKWYNEKRRH